jgi:hypothetical protein
MSVNPLDKVKGAIGAVQQVLDIKSEFDMVEVHKSLLEVRNDLFEAKNEILDLQEENRDLKAKLAIQDDIIDDPNSECLYILKSNVKVPYCRFCREESDALHRLPDANARSTRCLKCQNLFTINPGLPEETQIIHHRTVNHRNHIDMDTVF